MNSLIYFSTISMLALFLRVQKLFQRKLFSSCSSFCFFSKDFRFCNLKSWWYNKNINKSTNSTNVNKLAPNISPKFPPASPIISINILSEINKYRSYQLVWQLLVYFLLQKPNKKHFDHLLPSKVWL